jgi:hypothetical protein
VTNATHGGGGVWYELGTIVLVMFCDIVSSPSFFQATQLGFEVEGDCTQKYARYNISFGVSFLFK